MTIHLEITKLTDNGPTMNLIVSSQHQYRVPSASADGVSFSMNSPQMRQFVMATGIIALGTAPITGSDGRPAIFEGHRLAVSSKALVPLSARYEMLRQDIVASGVPLLNDEELRQEISERKGIRVEPAS